MFISFPTTFFEEHLSGNDLWDKLSVNWENEVRNWEDIDNL